ncbi:hypothetical protein [Deinococcus daejeonensis]|uniref:Uncharacterized protein n=1 Tax=Deinococcus daejeonensis TaxID=1007098 RepID=A0ABQ2IZY4_9DEIO|nr:hypothetical protein [Deinococcus daejeonensis]GGN32235.1 hypothetical protein GCM10010842_08730 [Deinococcus daejeonensis]
MSVRYLIGWWETGMIGGQPTFFWWGVTGASESFNRTMYEEYIGRGRAFDAWRIAFGPIGDGDYSLSDPLLNPWYVTLTDPLKNYPYDPETGAPLPGAGPVGGVGGPWSGGLGGDGPDGGPGPPPPTPRPGDGCEGMTYLVLSGLPVTTAISKAVFGEGGKLVAPPSNGMEAHAKLWTLLYAQNAEGTGLDFSQPPTRQLQWDRPLTPDGTVLWSGAGIQWSLMLELELLPVTVDGVRYEPVHRYHSVPTGCMDVGLPVAYRVQPGPGLLKDPVRVQLGEDQSGLFRDNRVSLTYVDGAPVTLSTPYRIGLETDPGKGVMSFELSSRRLDTTSGLVDWTGETILGRLARVHPFRDGFYQLGPFTPKAALDVLLNAIRVKADWLGWEDLPEFYLRGDQGRIPVTLDALAIEPAQDGPGPSAQDVLRQFFEPFGGYGFRVSRWGRLEVITPPWAADGPVTPVLTLTDADLINGEAVVLDETQVVNVCTVVSQGYVFQAGQVLPAASVRIGTHYEPVGADVLSVLWQPAEGVQAGGSSLSIDVHARAWADTGFIGPDEERDGGTQTLTLPMTPGASVTATFTVNYSAFSSSQASVTFTVVDVTGGLGVRVTRRLIHATSPTTYSWLFDFTAAGQTFGRSQTRVVATYGEGEAGADVAASRSAYGRREVTLDTGVYQVDVTTAMSMARAVVMDRLNPREVLTLPQAPPYPVRPEHVGRLVDAPGARGIVTGWSYTEQHTPQQSQSNSQFTLSVEQRLALQPVTLPDGTTLTRTSERRYHRARWGAARLKE